MPSATKIKFGDYLDVTDEGNGVIRVDGCCCDGSDTGSYEETILSHPCIAHYWPADELEGDLIDRKKGGSPGVIGSDSWDLVPDLWHENPTYGHPGPFPLQPDVLSVENAGATGVLANDHQGFGVPVSGFPWGGPITIEMWLRPTSYLITSATDVFFVYGGGSAVFLRMMGVGGSESEGIVGGALYWGRGSSVYVVDPEPLALETWHHIVCRYDGSTIDMWKNGVQVASVADSTSTDAGGNLRWLNIYTGGSSFTPFNGRAAQLAVYSCAISDEDIVSHWALADNPPSGGGSYVLPSTLPEIPATPTAQDVTDALVTLGLVTQA